MIEASFEAIVPTPIVAEFEAIIPREKALPVANQDVTYCDNGRYVVEAEPDTVMTKVNVEVAIPIINKEYKATSNGVSYVRADDGAMMKEVRMEVDVPNGYDLTSLGFSPDENDNFNRHYREAMVYANYVRQTYKAGDSFYNDKKLVIMPYVDTSSVTKVGAMFRNCSNLEILAQLDFSSAKGDFVQVFDYCSALEKVRVSIPLITKINFCFRGCSRATVYVDDATNVTSWAGTFQGLKKPYVRGWKAGNIVYEGTDISAESINYLIANAVSAADGATTRTLNLYAAAKANWQASENYEYYAAMAADKLITIA